MTATWRDVARPIIARVLEGTRELPVKERQKALREAYPFGMRKYHPYKIWLDEIARQTGRKTITRVVHEADPRQEDMFA